MAAMRSFMGILLASLINLLGHLANNQNLFVIFYAKI